MAVLVLSFLFETERTLHANIAFHWTSDLTDCFCRNTAACNGHKT